MNDRPSIVVRGLIAAAVAVAVNVALFYGFEAMGIELRIRPSSELIDMTVAPVAVVTAISSLIAVVVAVVLNRVTARARNVFSAVVVLAAFLSLLTLTSLDSSTMDRVFQGVMHLVPAAALVALVSPTLRSGETPRNGTGTLQP